MRPCEIPAKCHLCQCVAVAAELLTIDVFAPLSFADLAKTVAPSDPLPGVRTESRYVPLCWHHKIKRKATSRARFFDVLVMTDGLTARIDRDRAGGDVVCAACGRKYYDHPQCPDFPFLNVLCDGSVVKL